ncbi:arylsulfatase B-like isoform X2 [Haliotis rubra]|uniref:arylsulfatase B-like isoform X2 n=1 Tax=Haliotis rubra TaxID=36100 RepID=UPI001EE523B9|nr:arylsulfatase B-like isoform X2 [Haliotis rubra]
MYPDVMNEGRKTYCGMVSALDESVGNVTAALTNRGMMDNTLILFLSDNGPDMPFHGNSFPLRGGKLSIWEGGHRSVSFLHGVGLQRTGVTYDGLVHVVDWRPTLLGAATGGRGTPEADIDGINLWENIRTGSPSLRTEFVYNLDDVHADFFNAGTAAIRDGDYNRQVYVVLEMATTNSSSAIQGPITTGTDLKIPQRMNHCMSGATLSETFQSSCIT